MNKKAAFDAAGFAQAMAVYEEMAEIIGIFEAPAEETPAADGLSAEAIDALLAERETARATKNWGRADEIRDELKEQGIVIEDSSTGTRWKRA